jgi:enamine deaminase RidA (YjgF/YER057c/UK114 family)
VKRLNISSGTKWETSVGYSRAVRMGHQVWVAGTTAVDEDGIVVSPGEAEAQTAFILNKIAKALGQAGASLNDVVRTRIFITRVADQDAVGRAHAAVFAGIRPAATMVVISGLVDPRLLVEIEVDAYLA